MNRLHIIMYHYVREIEGSAYPQIKGLEYKLFLEQLDYFAKHFTFVTAEEVVAAVKQEIVLPKEAVWLTFDDGYKDHYRYVYPELKKRGIQGSFFMPAKVLNENTVLDVNKIHFILATREIKGLVTEIFEMLTKVRKQGAHLPSNEILYQNLAVANRWDNKDTIFVKRLFQNALPEELRNQMVEELFEHSVNLSEKEFSKELYLSKAEALEMKRDGMFFGIHGYDHYWLGKLSKDKAVTDVERSLKYCTECGLVEEKDWIMNYPYGSYSDETIEICRKLGARVGLSVSAGVCDLTKENDLALPRFDTNDFPPKSRNYLKLS